MDQGKKGREAMQSIGCCVDNCRYNDTQCKSCTAKHISVQNRTATQKGETFCDTFAPKTGF